MPDTVLLKIVRSYYSSSVNILFIYIYTVCVSIWN